MLYLLNKDVRTAKWNGLLLHETSSAIVKETLNGDFTLSIRYPITDSGIYKQIKRYAYQGSCACLRIPVISY